MDQKSLQLLRSDFPTYSKINLKITDKDGRLVPLVLNRMQRVLWALILRLISEGKPIRIYLVKARQLGSTTFFSAVLFWLITLNKNKRVIGIAQDDEAAENLNLRWQNYYFNSQPMLRPRFRKMNPKMIHYATPLKEIRKGEVTNIGLDSMMVVKTAESPQLGRSYTYNGALLTEFCIWPQLGINVKDRMIALKQAVPKRRNTAIFIESTAQGDNYGRKFWDDDHNGFEKVFVSWLADEEYRISVKPRQYFNLSEFEDGRYGNEILERRNIIAELQYWYPESGFGEDYPEFKHCLNSYQAWLAHESYCRIAWRRMMIDEECEGDKNAFKQEYPTTIGDAFGVSSKSVFGAIKLLEARQYLKLSDVKPKRFSYRHPNDIKTSNLKDVLFPFSKGGLRIYEPPQRGCSYVCGADTAQGVPGGDDSSFVILKLSPEIGKLVEVASCNLNIEATEFAGLLYIIGNWYNNALIGVERNHKSGFAILESLRKELRYKRLYWHTDRDPLAKTNTATVKWGWDTEGPSRQIMVRDGITWFKNDYIIIRSEEILDQMDTFVENPKTGKIAASGGNFDDLVLALLIAEQLSKQIHIKDEAPSNEKLPYFSLGWFTAIADKQKGIRSNFNKRSGKRRVMKYA